MSEIESPPVFRLIDDPLDPENVQRLEAAEKFKRDNPSGVVIHRLIVRPSRGESNWKNVSRVIGMPYQVKYRPRTRLYDGIVKDGIAEKDSAAAAWTLVQQLEISDEKILEIRGPSGRLMSRGQLRELAHREAN